MSEHHDNPNLSAAYAALRFQGAPAEQARRELRLGQLVGSDIETRFIVRATTSGGKNAMVPRSNDGRHLAALSRAGGFPVLSRQP